MPTTKAAAARELARPLAIGHVSASSPGEGLVELGATGVCHTDLHSADSDRPSNSDMTRKSGNEGVGYVAALGDGGVRTERLCNRDLPFVSVDCVDVPR